MSSFREVEKTFRDLQSDVAERVRLAMPEAGDALCFVDARDDGAYWFDFGGRRVRMELTVGKQIVILVFEGDENAPVRRMPGVLGAPAGIAETIAMALKRKL